jgi:hypothetical protein
MKKTIISTVLLSAISFASFACTLCGCSATNQYLGILPPSKNNFVGLQYQSREFSSIHDDEFDDAGNNVVSNEYYNTVQAWGRYNIGSSLQIFAFVPYVINTKIEEGVTTRESGLGDITLLANMRILGNKCTGKILEHSLQAGAGIKMPTGKYDVASVKYLEGLPNMQPGSRSFDFIANANYTITRKMIGLNIDGSYTATTANLDKYKYGNRLSTGLMAFYIIKYKQVSVLPQMGVRYDISGTDYDNYSAKTKNDMTGGNQLYGAAALQAYYRHFGLQLTYHKPLSQHYADGLVNNKFKTEAAIYFLF